MNNFSFCINISTLCFEFFSYFFPNCFQSLLLKIWAFPRENQHCWLCNLDQPKHAAQAYPDRHFSPPVDFLFQESLLYTSIPWDGRCRSGSVCAGWSGSIHYADAIMLVFSLYGSFVVRGKWLNDSKSETPKYSKMHFPNDWSFQAPHNTVRLTRDPEDLECFLINEGALQ